MHFLRLSNTHIEALFEVEEGGSAGLELIKFVRFAPYQRLVLSHGLLHWLRCCNHLAHFTHIRIQDQSKIVLIVILQQISPYCLDWQGKN